MTVTAIPVPPGEPEGTPMRTVAMGLRNLIISGQHFRDQRAQELHLGPSDLVALTYLYHDGSMAPGKLAGLMGVTSGTMTALLDRVEKAGFLRREHNPEDRRGLLIHLTPAGDHAMQWLYDQHEQVIREALARVPGLNVDRFHAALEVLSESLETGAAEQVPTASTTPAAPTPVHHI